MTTNNLRVAPAQQIGPLQVWPLLWENLATHQYNISADLRQLEFAEIEEEEGPVIDWIEVHNPTDHPILIPSGWVVTEGLLQERTLIASEYVEAHTTSAIQVSCVEKGRWEETAIPRKVVRAPISILAAGFNFDSNKGIWVLDQKTRQERVWKQIESYEIRSGVRETNSLTQIMSEDADKFRIQQNVSRAIKEVLSVYPKQNGVLIALDGKPLLSEFFSNPEGIVNTLNKTLMAASFDAQSEKVLGIDKETVTSYLAEVKATKIHLVQEESWGGHYSGGSGDLDTNLTKFGDERVMQVSTLNRSHPALVGV
jgi:sulfur transfer complex TusBCD TusB component (DsrH family)